MSDTVTYRGQGRKLFEGWLDHKGRQLRSSYRSLWVVLKDDVLHIFSEKDRRDEETAVGSLIIDKSCKFSRGTGNSDRDGYKFELSTNNGAKTNRFKAKKKVEMEFWRGYIVGLSKGTIPTDLDLMQDQIDRIKADIDSWRQTPSHRASMTLSADSGIEHQSISNYSHNSSGSRSIISGGGGGPLMRHKFTNDPAMNDRIPSWFIVNCDRKMAEEVLVNSKDFGNTLMRESSRKNEGSYVISKMTWIKGKEPQIDHYEIERVDRGYKLKIENRHSPLSNLTDVMNYFLFTSGVETTEKLRTNNLTVLGISETDDPYQMKKIERYTPEKSWELPEPLPDYEEPVPSRPKTFNPGILKKEASKYNSDRRHSDYPTALRASMPQTMGRKSVPVNQPITSSLQTQAKDPPPPPACSPSTDEFDPPDPHVSSLYYNTAELTSQPVPDIHVPPPAPHVTSRKSYVNEESESDIKPPHHARSKSVPNIAQPLGGLKLSPSDINLKKKVIHSQAPIKSVKPAQYRQQAPAAQPMPATTVPAQPMPALPMPVQPMPALPMPVQPMPVQPMPALPMPVQPMPAQQQPQQHPSVPASPNDKLKVVGILKKTGPAVAPKTQESPTPTALGLRPVPKDTKKDTAQQGAEGPGIDESDPGSVKNIISMFQQQQPKTASGPVHAAPPPPPAAATMGAQITNKLAAEQDELYANEVILTIDSSEEDDTDYVDGVSVGMNRDLFKRQLEAKLGNIPSLAIQRQLSGSKTDPQGPKRTSEAYDEEVYAIIPDMDEKNC